MKKEEAAVRNTFSIEKNIEFKAFFTSKEDILAILFETEDIASSVTKVLTDNKVKVFQKQEIEETLELVFKRRKPTENFSQKLINFISHNLKNFQSVVSHTRCTYFSLINNSFTSIK